MTKVNTAAEPAQKISKRTLLTYSVGGIGRDMSYTLYSTFLLTFILYTKSLSDLQFTAISIIMIICRIWDAVNDPIMGVIIENTRTKWGKFKPWIFIGVISNSVVLVSLFSMRLQSWSFVVFFAFMYLIWDITFTMNDIGYWSMLPSLTSNSKDRNLLTSLANVFAGMGSIISVSLIPILTVGKDTIGGNTVTAYACVSAIIACCFIGGQMMTVFGVQERNVCVDKSEPSIGLGKIVKIIIKNDQLLWVALVMLLYNTGSAIITGLGTNYIYFQYGYNGSFVTKFVVTFGAASGIIMLLFPALCAKLTRKALITIAIIMVILGYSAIFLISLISTNYYILCVCGAFIGLGQSTIYMVLTVNITNTVEYNEWKTGSRNEGIIFSIRPFMAKMGSALQSAVIMIVYLALGVTDFTNKISDAENSMYKGIITEGEKLNQINGILASVPEKTTLYMRACMVAVPMILLLASYIILIKKCTIDEKKYNEMVADIAQRKELKSQSCAAEETVTVD
ncbi:MAG: MFS transporter [Clostridiales bacterium]|nr:MFS transporter [Clostridiales bacterium]